MTDVVDVSTITWVIETVQGTTQVIAEATTQVISEEIKAYQVIDTASNTTDVIETTNTQVVEQTLESVVEVQAASNTTVDITESNPVIIYTEEKVPYTSKVDTVSDSLIYKGEATPGTLTSESSWRIQKILFSDNGDDVDITWADGQASFDKVWDNRLSYVYT